jgi:hypothetical protein
MSNDKIIDNKIYQFRVRTVKRNNSYLHKLSDDILWYFVKNIHLDKQTLINLSEVDSRVGYMYENLLSSQDNQLYILIN